MKYSPDKQKAFVALTDQLYRLGRIDGIAYAANCAEELGYVGFAQALRSRGDGPKKNRSNEGPAGLPVSGDGGK